MPKTTHFKSMKSNNVKMKKFSNRGGKNIHRCLDNKVDGLFHLALEEKFIQPKEFDTLIEFFACFLTMFEGEMGKLRAYYE